MGELVADCPRCGASKVTFDLGCQIPTHLYAGWQQWFESYCVCRACLRSTIFVLAQRDPSYGDAVNKLVKLDEGVNRYVEVKHYISLKDEAAQEPPDHLPSNVEAAFREGSACMSINCSNAAGTMFRLCLDLATRAMLPEGDTAGLNARTRRDLGLRLPWLFDNKLLPENLRELSSCIRDDANDGAHQGTLSKEDAKDIQDFTYIFLERIYTEPKKLELAKERRAERRKK